MAALAAQREYGRGEDLQVEPQRQVLNVEQVIFNPLVKVASRTIMAADLPKTRDSRADRQASLTPRHADLVFAERRRPRSHQTHFPDQNVEKLRQFVDIEGAQDSPVTAPKES